MHPDAASRICTACGMCCNGVLFQVVRLQPGDSVQELSRLGLPLRRKKREPYFTQPCPCLSAERRCSIYESRPTRCRLFNCQQIQRLEAGTSTEAEVMAQVTHAHQLLGQVEQLLPPPTTALPLAERAELAQNPALIISYAQLQSHLDSEFRV
jgi:uncharacterized protein